MSPAEGVGAAEDAFRFVYMRVKGDTNFVVRVPEAQGASARRVGIMFRNALTPDAAHSSFLADGTGTMLVRRAGAGLEASETRVAATPTPVWFRLERRGAVVNAYHSTDGTVWTLASSDTIPLASDFYVGMAVSAGLNVGPAAGAFDHVSLSSVAANRPPVVQMTAPSPLRIYQPGAAVTIAANASDPDDRLSKVDFFANGSKVGSDSSAPYSVTWTAGPIGPYVLTAVASDFDGASTTSLPVPILSLGLPGTDPDPDPDPEDPRPSGPWQLQFEPSWGQETVDYYVLEIYLASTRALVVSKDVGKPPLAPSGVSTLDVDGTVSQLPAGQYEVVLRAVDPFGTTPSSPTYFAK
jgi:regulation of enolase protein 1 (concanavalin A-like superfamily)